MSPNELPMIAASTALVFLAVFLLGVWNIWLWDAFTAWMTTNFMDQMRGVGLETARVKVYLRWWGFALVGTVAASIAIGIPIIGVALVFFVYVAPQYVLEIVIARRRALLRDQLVGATTAMANAARSGQALAQALESVAKEAPRPLAWELRRIVNEYNSGRTLPDALRDAKARIQLDGFTLFTSAVLTCLDRGGRITDALERISKSLQENQRLERKLEAETASGRKVVLLLVAFPVVFLAGFYLMDPGATGILFSTIVGQLVVVTVLALSYLAARWARKILTINL